ncbi:MAG: tetratricopeptide repeat protein [Sorangiineae bacterium]|nr:tetratricopeptide repeat protein [Polyangiaceae bacterium]MEB2322050.1 tetratricopeptide repeat protein [Sorangiineae bacterium]
MRAPKSLWRVTSVLLVALASAPALAQAGDARAQSLARDAMEQDYLATNFKAAIAKLQTALKSCEKSKCSPATVAKIYASLGTVYSAGLAQKEDAIEAFKAALKNDPSITPDSNYLTGEVQSAFEEAKKASGPAPVVVEKAVAPLTEKPWTEQATWRPVPVYVELPDGIEAARVVTRYKAPGQDWKELTLQKHGKGYAGYIPCAAVESEGELLYFTTAFDANFDRMASGGSTENPRKIQLKKAIDTRQPSLPDAVPPQECPRPVERLSCETNDDCPGNQACVNLQCVDKSTVPNPEAGKDQLRKKNWVSLGFSPDLSLVNSTSDACSQAAQSDGTLSCFFGGGIPVGSDPLPSGSSNSLNGGVATGTMRVTAAYDRVLGTRMTLGLRAGFAFLGPPKDFLPLHLEARFAFFFAKDPFVSKGVRPYVFAGAGLAESAARVTTPIVVDTGQANPERKNVDVYQKGGSLFAGLGAGLQYAVSPNAAMVVEVMGREAFPKTATVLAPYLGFAYGL